MKKLLFLLILPLATVIASAQPRQITVKEFLKLSKKDTTSYIVQGVVSRIANPNSGSFYIEDKTGTLHVYGIVDPANPKSDFRKMDIAKGDDITVLGRFGLYNGEKEMIDGRLVNKVNGANHDQSVIERIDTPASFKGKKGDEALNAFSQWVQKKLKQPADGAKGTVVLRFVVGRNGKVQEIQVTSGLSTAANEEAIRVVKKSPKWKPARIDGRAIRMAFTLNVVFE